MVKSKVVEINLTEKIESVVCERVIIMELYQRNERKVTVEEELCTLYFVLCTLVRYKTSENVMVHQLKQERR